MMADYKAFTDKEYQKLLDVQTKLKSKYGNKSADKFKELTNKQYGSQGGYDYLAGRMKATQIARQNEKRAQEIADQKIKQSEIDRQASLKAEQDRLQAEKLKASENANNSQISNNNQNNTNISNNTEQNKKNTNKNTPAPVETPVNPPVKENKSIDSKTNWADTDKTMGSLEQMVESRYGVMAHQKNGKLYAETPDGKSYEWSIQDGKPVKKLVEAIPEDTTGFDDIKNQWLKNLQSGMSREELTKFAKKNAKLITGREGELKTVYLQYQKDKEFQDKIATLETKSGQALVDMFYKGNLSQKEFNALSPDKQKEFNDLKKISDKNKVNKGDSDLPNFDLGDSNTPNAPVSTGIVTASEKRKQLIEDNGLNESIKNLTTSKAAYDKKVKEYKGLRRKIEEANPHASRSYINALIRKEGTALEEEMDQLKGDYETQFNEYSLKKELVIDGMKDFEYDQKVAVEAYNAKLKAYTENQKILSAEKKYKFEAEQARLTAERAFKEKKYLIDYQSKVDQGEGKWIERDEGIYFATKGGGLKLIANGGLKTNDDGSSTYTWMDDKGKIQSEVRDIKGRVVGASTSNTNLSQNQVNMLNAPAGSILKSKYGKKYNSNGGMQCGEYVNTLTGLGLGDSYSSKLSVANEKNGTIGSVAVRQVKPDSKEWSKYGHTGIIVGDEGSNWIIKSSNFNNDGKITFDRVPKNKIDGYKSTNLLSEKKPDYNEAQSKFLGTVDLADFGKEEKLTMRKLGLSEDDVYSYRADNLDDQKKKDYQSVLDAIDSVFEAGEGDGLSDALGIYSFFRTVHDDGSITFTPGTDAAAFASAFETLQSKMTLPQMSLMKGVLSDSDIKMLKAAGNEGLSLSLGESEFKKRMIALKKGYSKLLGQQKVYNYINESGDGFTANDISQLDGLVSSGELTQEEVDYFKKKNNIK